MIDSFINYTNNDNEGSKYNKAEKGANSNFFDRIIIKKGSDWKNNFDNIMLLASVYNSFTQAYQAAFGDPDSVA